MNEIKKTLITVLSIVVYCAVSGVAISLFLIFRNAPVIFSLKTGGIGALIVFFISISLIDRSPPRRRKQN